MSVGYYKLEDNFGQFYDLRNFRPETEYPGTAKSFEMTRGYNSLDLYVSSLDTLRDAAPWVWSGVILATGDADMTQQLSQFSSFLRRATRVWRNSDNSWIDIYGISSPTIVNPNSKVRREVTFIVAPRRLSWRRESTSLYGEGLYGEGIYAGGEFEESY